ncbi:MAG: glutamine-hydrolyzing GMP synthase [Candidatus Micrarchaeia archaeon]
MGFDPKKFIERSVAEIREQVGSSKAIIAVSGGVDSSVAAALVNRAVSGRLVAVFVDTGLMRIGEAESVKNALGAVGIDVLVVDASDRFFSALKGIKSPEKKRKVIGETFIRVFEEIAEKEGVEFLVQGTIAPDWIESGGMGRDRIKSHHNVGGLPSRMKLKLIEPLRELYKHEVRMLARELGLPESISERQPFPGPGIGVRIIGEITREKADIAKRACKIVEEEIEAACRHGEIKLPWQYFAALMPTRTVGVRGDERAYQYTVVVRCVDSLDGMTANFSRIPPHVLEKISTRITNEIREVGRVLYDITNKPPGTIEME